MRQESMRAGAALIAGIVVIWAANTAGLWWVTPLAGLVIGLFVGRGWLAAGVGTLVGAAGWGGPLVWQAMSAPIGAAASAVSGVMGIGSGAVVIALTVLLGLLLALTGAWLGSALRRLAHIGM